MHRIRCLFSPTSTRLSAELFATKQFTKRSVTQLAEKDYQSSYLLEQKEEPPFLDRIREYKNNIVQQEQDLSNNSQLVNNFINHTDQFYNHIETELDPNADNKLELLLEQYTENIKSLSFDELKGSLEALACWPQAVRLRRTFRVPDKAECMIAQLYDLFKEEYERRSRSSVGPELYISNSYLNIERIMDLCDIWETIDKTNRWGFISIAINKLGNSEGNSKGKLKRMDKDTFVRFIKHVGNSNLNAKFHTYYCTFKFYDLIQEMTLEDIEIACKTMIKKRIFGSDEHPIEVQLKQRIIDKLIDNIHQVTDEMLDIVFNFLTVSQSASTVDHYLKLQKKIIESGAHEKLGFEGLISAASYNSKLVRMQSVDHRLIDIIVKKGLKLNDKELLALRNVSLRNLGILLAYHKDTPLGRLLLLRIRDVMLAEVPKRLEHADLVHFQFALILLHISNHQTIEILMKSPTLFKFFNGEFHIRNELKFGGTGEKRGVGMLLTSLHGFLDLEYPDYKGPKALGNLQKTLIHYSILPGEINHEDFVVRDKVDVNKGANADDTDKDMEEDGGDHYEKEDKITNHTYRYVMHKLFRSILYELYGAEKVCETMVLPHLGILGHVMLIDKNGTPINIPQEFQNLKVTETKRGDPELGTWIFIFKLSETRNYNHVMRIGGINGVHRLLRKVGFKPVILENDELNQLEKEYRLDQGHYVTVAQDPQLLQAYKQFIDAVLQQKFLSLKK